MLGKGIYKHNGHVYDDDCYTMFFAKKCAKCYRPITGDVKGVMYDGRSFHNDCFLCAGCRKPLSGGKFFKDRDDEKKLLCEGCKLWDKIFSLVTCFENGRLNMSFQLLSVFLYLALSLLIWNRNMSLIQYVLLLFAMKSSRMSRIAYRQLDLNKKKSPIRRLVPKPRHGGLSGVCMPP